MELLGEPDGVAEVEEEAVLEADSEADVEETVAKLEVVEVAVEWTVDWASAPTTRVKVMRVKRMVKTVKCLLEENVKV